jgi:hypothetical protein
MKLVPMNLGQDMKEAQSFKEDLLLKLLNAFYTKNTASMLRLGN